MESAPLSDMTRLLEDIRLVSTLRFFSQTHLMFLSQPIDEEHSARRMRGQGEVLDLGF